MGRLRCLVRRDEVIRLLLAFAAGVWFGICVSAFMLVVFTTVLAEHDDGNDEWNPWNGGRR